MKFHQFKNMLERPYITYADVECSQCEEVDEHGNTRTKHVPNSACFYFVCTYDHSKNKLWYAVGEDCVIKMILELYKLAKECIK